MGPCTCLAIKVPSALYSLKGDGCLILKVMLMIEISRGLVNAELWKVFPGVFVNQLSKVFGN